MDSLSVNTKKLINCAAQAGVEHTDLKDATGSSLNPTVANTTIKLSEVPFPVLEALLRTGRLQAPAKAAIRKVLGDTLSDTDIDEPLNTVTKVNNILSRFIDEAEPTLECDLGNHTYPIFAVSSNVQNSMMGKFLWADFNISMTADGEAYIQKSLSLSDAGLSEHHGGMTIRQILDARGMRPIKKETLDRWKSDRPRVHKMMQDEIGKQYICTGSAVKVTNSWWNPTVVLPKGYIGRVVIEPEMEANPKNTRYTEANIGFKHLQLVRCFSLDTKEYVYIDVADLKEYEYDTRANERLVLPEDMKGILTSLFNWNGSEGFGDIFNDRHGGVVVLAAGKPGVGKTLTAEVYASIMQRPLYSIDLTELGTNVAQVEASLSIIFQRVTRWNAVLLLDEADIFMAERTKEELERSAIVGVFLRVLDRYKGTLFLTTNRTEVLDPAFASRITVKLVYPDLNVERRQKIWELMLEKAKIVPEGDLSPLAEVELNGRQIRNCVRLMRIMHPEAEKLSVSTLVSIAKMSA
jgi:hypothetical protein